MDGPVNLATLPHDIIRMIIRLEDTYAVDFHLISHSWNTLASENRALERVHFHIGELDNRFHTTKQEEEKIEDRRRVHMHTILPKRHANKTGLAKWLTLHYEYSEDAVELACVPQQLAEWSDARFHHSMLAVISFLASILTAIAACYTRFAINEVMATLMCFAFGLFFHRVSTREGAKRAKNRSCFTRFFNLFSRIETLVLERFDISELKSHYRQDVLDAVKKTLKGVQIDRLEVHGNVLDEQLQKAIVQICRENKVQYVLITANMIRLTNFVKFARKISDLDVTVDFIEVLSSNSTLHFNYPRLFWDDMAADLSNHQVSMRMFASEDVTFTGYAVNVKSHIRIEKSNGFPIQLRKPVYKSRGFGFVW